MFVVLVIVCLLVGMGLYRLVLPMLGLRLQYPDDKPLVPPVVEVPVAVTSEVVEVAPLTPEVVAIEVMTPEAVPVIEEVPTIIKEDKVEMTEAEARQLMSTMSFKKNFLADNKLFAIEDIIFPRTSSDYQLIHPLVVNNAESNALKQLVSDTQDSSVQKGQLLAQYIYTLRLEDIGAELYIRNKIFPTITPEDEEVEEYYESWKSHFSQLDSRYVQSTEHLKEAVKIFLLRKNLARYLLAAYQEAVLTKRIKLHWPSAEPPWSVLGAGPAVSTTHLAVGATTEVVGATAEVVGAIPIVSGATAEIVGATTGINATVLTKDTKLFTMDGEMMMVSGINHMLSRNMPVITKGLPESLYHVLERILPPEEEKRDNLVSWLSNFRARDRETLVYFVFAALVRSRLKSSKFLDGELEGIDRSALKLNALIKVAVCAAELSQEHEMGLGAEIITGIPVLIQFLTESPFTYGVVLANPLRDLAWTDLNPYHNARQLRVVPKQPLKYLPLPKDETQLQELVYEWLYDKNMLGREVYGVTLSSRVRYTVSNSILSLFDTRFAKKYPLGYLQGVIRDQSFIPDKLMLPAEEAEFLAKNPHGKPLSPDAIAAASKVHRAKREKVFEQMYDNNASLFKVGLRYKFQVLFHTDRNVLEKALASLREGRGFSQAMFRYGLLYPEGMEAEIYPADTLQPAFSKALSALEPGGVSNILEISSPVKGFALVYLLEVKEPETYSQKDPMVQEVLDHFYFPYFINLVTAPVMKQGGGFVKEYARWFFPSDSQEVKDLLAKASTAIKKRRF